MDDGIKATLNGIDPKLTPFVDVIPMPANEFEFTEGPPLSLHHPVAVGMLGAITRAKGFITYAEFAKKLSHEHGHQLLFHIVGRLNREFEGLDFSCFQQPVSFEDLPRASFVERIKHLHFVCLPLQDEYYALAASGTLIDAITFRKPIIAFSSVQIDPLFAEFGDIGYRCRDKGEFEAALLQISRDLDVARYARQVSAMTVLYHSRTAEALSAKVRSYLSPPQVGVAES